MATGGCWIVAGVVRPGNGHVVWGSLGAGMLIAYGSVAVSRMIGRGSEVSHLRALVSNAPTFFGLCAMAFSTQVATFDGAAVGNVTVDRAPEKAIITAILIAAFVVEQLMPYLREAVRALRRKVRMFVRDVVAEALRENHKTT
ncbi:hypothetical protein [Actinoplanes nipponensis]|uniref:hypothetical protein n=1 Tax=Actinoplanes nipponensis TaxID=135950 RepID=UPI0031EFF808